MISVQLFNADKTGSNVCTDQINAAIAHCHETGGGTVCIEAGTYKTGAIKMLSNVTLYIEAGATLDFVNDRNEYPIIDTRWEGIENKGHASCIYAQDAENISITGRGTLEGNGSFWWSLFRNKEMGSQSRPKLIGLDRCKNVLIEGITLKNSPSWTVNPVECEVVTVTGISILNPSDSPNTDGINPESCRNVHISNCHIDVGDDCIAIKAGTEDTKVKVPCENITITNCTMVHGHGGVVLGSELSGSVRNVVISNCIFDGTDRGIRLKTRRKRGGTVEDIMINNIYMRDVLCPFIMNMYYFCGKGGKEPFVSDKNPYPIDEGTPTFRNIQISNVTARNVSSCAGFMYGLAERFIEGVTLDNFTVELAKEATPEVPAMMDGVEPMAKKGFFVSNARDIRFNNIRIKGQDGKAFILNNVEDLRQHNCDGFEEDK